MSPERKGRWVDKHMEALPRHLCNMSKHLGTHRHTDRCVHTHIRNLSQRLTHGNSSLYRERKGEMPKQRPAGSRDPGPVDEKSKFSS